MMKKYGFTSLMVALLVCVLALPTVASDFSQPQIMLYPYQTSVVLQDDFVAGFPAAAAVGDLGWTFSGGTVATLAPEASRPGIIRRDTSTTISTVASFQLNNASRNMLSSETYSFVYISRLNTNDANTQVRIGIQGSSNGNPDASGVYLEKLDADTNWFCVTRSAAAQTRTDSGVAISTSFFSMAVTKNSSGVQFSLNGANVCSLISTNVPTDAVLPVVQIVNSAAFSKTIDIDYFQLIITGLVR